MFENGRHHDALFLFVCALEWHSKRNLAAYQELLAALDNSDCDIRTVAEVLLQRRSPRPQPAETDVEAW
jgi:hypothetical protein